MLRWVSTRDQRKRDSKKGWEVDGFGTIGNLLRGKRRFGKRETTRYGKWSENRWTGEGSERMMLSAERDIIRSRM